MSYLKREHALYGLSRMQSFHEDLRELFDRNDFDLLDDLGRRNILLSRAQEKYFAEALKKDYPTTYSDGTTGQPDIVIPSENAELECKLTSRHRSGTWSFQSDYETLAAKGELDYCYVLADAKFQEFAVLFFKGLTTEDFRSPAPGSRGKVQMYKHKGMKKCTVLVGTAQIRNELFIEGLEDKIEALSARAHAAKEKLEKKIEYWQEQPDQYSFCLEKIQGDEHKYIMEDRHGMEPAQISLPFGY